MIESETENRARRDALVTADAETSAFDLGRAHAGARAEQARRGADIQNRRDAGWRLERGRGAQGYWLDG